MEQMEARLAELRQEYVTGESRLRELAQQEAALREMMLRISGAIQVLEELVAAAASAAGPAADGSAGDDDAAPGGSPSEPKVLTVP
jgi:septal ring factor EnvC (AmiA/AmiB activator)